MKLVECYQILGVAQNSSMDKLTKALVNTSIIHDNGDDDGDDDDVDGDDAGDRL